MYFISFSPKNHIQLVFFFFDSIISYFYHLIQNSFSMHLPIFIVDAFTTKLFGGNPAAVCPLDEWLPDELMQALAAENNLAETVFFVKEGEGYRIRWFTPAVEVKLCGHATLASAHIMYTELGYTGDEIVFNSLSGPLKVKRTNDGKIQLDFPASSLERETEIPQAIIDGLHIEDVIVYKTAFDYMVIVPSQTAVESLQPDFNAIATLEARGVIVTAKGDEADFVSRFFAPQSGINEDPVTGSAHTALVPYWSQVLGKKKLNAIQVSKRRGYLDCELAGDRVLMSGNAVTYSKGSYRVNGEL